MLAAEVIHSLTEDDVLQLPDIQFVSYCFREYGLNRGIYNTIDEWLYAKGIALVIARRQLILTFLSAQRASERPRGAFLKFGKGGLTRLLDEFAEKHGLGVSPG